MEPLNLFPSVIWKGHYDGDLSGLKERALYKLTHGKSLNSRVERDGGVSSSTDKDAPHYWLQSREFILWMQSKVSEVWKSWGYPECHIDIGASWVNLHPKGGWTDEHTHGETPMVVVLYIEQPENGGNLMIFDPMFHHWMGGLRTYLPYKEIEVKTGDVLIFPGWLLHKTQKNLSDQDRIVMSINVSKVNENYT